MARNTEKRVTMATVGQPARQPTMGDIAARLGVSRQLVSLALRDAPGASAETRDLVRKVAAELGYQPHIGARTLRQSASLHLGVVFTPAHATEPDIVEGIYPAADERGYRVVLSAQTPTRTTGQAVDELLGYRCAALIVIGSTWTVAELRALAGRSTVPLVMVGAGSKNAYYDVVRSAGDVGIALTLQHLVELGHREIVYVHGKAMPPARLRLAGYLRAAARLGVRPRVLTMTGGYTEECGATAARQLLSDAELPTAVMASNDQAALGVMLVLTRAGLSVPGDVSVTGFDDSWIARLSSVDLTTARQDPAQMGVAAVEAAVRRVRAPTARPTELIILPELIVRGSTGPPRAVERSATEPTSLTRRYAPVAGR
jgi:DNA-binding LacI/PurR family transcriptional regulator